MDTPTTPTQPETARLTADVVAFAPVGTRPRALRFRTNGPVETWLIFPAFTVLAVLLMPGALDLAGDAVAQVMNR